MIRVRTLGGLSAGHEDATGSGTPIQPRRLAVLALVARFGDHGVTREFLLALLWPDADEVAGRRALSQALHALRSDLHDGLFVGMQELRLNRAVASSDIAEFEEAVAEQDWERAAGLYAGPFLQGFRLGAVREFDRWVEDQRTQLSMRQAEVLERLARLASDRGDRAGAVGWWRRRAAMDPLNARVTVELMRGLVALGERHAAMQQAQIYQAIVEQELSLPPDAEVTRYAEELRRASPEPPRATMDARLPRDVGVPSATAPAEALAPPSTSSSPVGRRSRVGQVLAALAVVGFIALFAVLRPGSTPRRAQQIAVGAIEDYRGSGATAPLQDMLATSLARLPGLQVTSTGRLLELIEQAGKRADPAAFAAAARRAGASELMEGGLHPAAGGLVLALRRIDIATGRVLGAWRVEGEDVFALVDQATAELAADMGYATKSLGPGEPNTRSLVAWRFYEEGLRRSARGDNLGARGLFEAALREDSAFAMAAYQWLRAGQEIYILPDSAQLDWLTRLARRTNDRDRLQILGWVAFMTQSPALSAIADTLIIRYPADVESQFLAGFSRMARADFAAALPYLRQVLDADEASMGTATGRCLACTTMPHVIYAYVALDSLSRAIGAAEEWVRRDSQSVSGRAHLAGLLDLAGRAEEAITVRRRATPYDTYDNIFPAIVRARAGDFRTADQIARAELAGGADEESAWHGFWLLLISLRYQARWQEVIGLSERQRRTSPIDQGTIAHLRRLRQTEALVLFEAGRVDESIRILDSLSRGVDPRLPVNALGGRALMRILEFTMLAEAALAAGHIDLVVRAADSAEAWASRTDKLRERGIATHARALVRLGRGDTAEAMRLFERAIYSRTMGFTRSNYHLARLLMAQGEPRKAADLLSPALRGALDSQNYFLTHTEVRELLARAYARLGEPDSARIHWRWVAGALAHADSGALPRYQLASSYLGQ